jgi:ribonuclease HI
MAEVILAFCDGAAKGNPGPGGWGVIVVTPDGIVTELGGRDRHTTNNRMELTAAIQALTHLPSTTDHVDIYTDSTYVIRGIQDWIGRWRRHGWRTRDGGSVLNRELWQQLDTLVSALPPGALTWHFVRGHVGIPGNERVDAIADALARDRPVDLYAGPLSGYPLPIFDVPEDTSAPSRSRVAAGRSPGSTAYSYLSLVDGELKRHATWTECESRVKGRSGARFKKAASRDDEIAILRSWGLPPTAL